MAKPRAFIETTIVSYLTAWPSKDPIITGRQLVTRAWWAACRERYDLVTSITVVEEAQAGDPEMAQARLAVLGTIPLVPVSPEAVQLADELVRAGVVPERRDRTRFMWQPPSTNGVDYLVTWNCKHLANAALRKRSTAVASRRGSARSSSARPTNSRGTGRVGRPDRRGGPKGT